MTTRSDSHHPSVAVLGVGIMGSAMARNLVRARLTTTVWDRSEEAASSVAASGALMAPTAADAVRDVDVVITMLPTADVVSSVLLDDASALGSVSAGAVWAQMGTIGIEATADIAARLGRERPDVMFVDAPVSGSKGPAESGQLLILASGPDAARPVLDPVFAAIGRSTVWLGEAGQGSKMKLVINAYLATLIEGVAEAVQLATQLGIDPARLDDAIKGGPLDAPLADAKLHKMEQQDYAPEFPLEWALKDVDLALAAADGASLPALAALSQQWHKAVDAGHGRQDISAALLSLRSQS